MAVKKSAWWQNPQTVISCLVGIGAIGGWIISQFVADAKQQDAIEDVQKDVQQLDGEISADLKDLSDELAQQDEELTDTQQQYMMIQQDMGYVKNAMKEILDEVKHKK